MALPIGVMSVFAALVVWACLAVYAVMRGKFLPVMLFGVVLMLYLNLGYVVNGPAAAIANFVGIYDVLINLGLTDPATANAVLTCPDNSCSVWGDTYTNHPAWGVAFYDRFANGPEMRSALLLGHVICNSIVFVLMHVQMFFPGGTGRNHTLIGRISFAVLTLGIGCAVILAAQHGSVGEYGGIMSSMGFFSMSMCVYATAIMGVLAIRRKDTSGHRIWMWRFVGSMWGSFWLFRIVLFVIDPLFRDIEALAIQICIWGSAPAGILIAEIVRRKLDAKYARIPYAAG
ncbi:MAG: hypothetical protein GJ676_17120 [Rhodobacteraceae bacterium]|nr:hypothetical protein [Paracoccaceae bacterium]